MLEEALPVAGMVVWPMGGSARTMRLPVRAAVAARDARVERVLICWPDKVLGQCVASSSWIAGGV